MANINNKTLVFIAPFVLRYYASKERENARQVEQYEYKDVVLMSIWRTRCQNPRVDIIIWLPWQSSANSIVHLKGTDASAFLRNRYTALDVVYAFEEAHL